MCVIVLNTQDELDFLRLQKVLAKKFSTNSQIMCATSPLWIDFSIDEQNLKNVSQKIESITIEGPALCEEGIFCPVKIVFDNLEYESKLQLCKTVKRANILDENAYNKKTDSDLKSESAFMDFPRNLRIFRLGEKEEINPYTKALLKSVWKKLPLKK